MRFTYIDINFDIRYEGHQNCPKILSMNILRVFSDHHLLRQNWRQYLWTSLCQFNFFVNLLHSLGVWFFDIWHLFENLTSFWQLDIFLIFWEQIAHGPHCPCGPYPCIPLATWPIPLVPHTPCAHVSHTTVPIPPSGPHCPYAPYPLYPIPPMPPLPIGPIPLYPIAHTPVPHTPCAPIVHRPHGPCGLYPLYPIPPVHYCPMCPIAYHPCPQLGDGPYG